MTTIYKVLAPLSLVLPLHPAWGMEEDGYDLWLRYRALGGAAKTHVAARAKSIVHPADPSLTTQAAIAELHRGLTGMLGASPKLARKIDDGALVLATPASMPKLKTLGLPLASLGGEGYLLRAMKIDGKKVTLVAANTDIGLLYGTYAWLRAALTRRDLGKLDEVSVPKVQLRMLNHWDNLDRTVERGYAGESIWDWWALPDVKDARYVDYARANASLGINAASLNNVNSKKEILTAPWIAKAAAVADVLRPYGIKVYLSVRWSAPVELEELQTADPLDAKVGAWWKKKADEIYAAIPDFGGFVVKANSEGQPGPHDYQRTHADGANMLAEALAPHGGLVLWRAFVYSQHNTEDRAKQAYSDFIPLDGKFLPNVLVQVKNGPIDFQPREPFHPMFGAMPKTPLLIEFQITKEYLGFATHIAYLGDMYEEVLEADTYRKGPGSTVAKVIDGRLHGNALTGMSGVANIGSSRTWSGSHFDQANWYAFGRLAWDPEASAKDFAKEWAAQTFSSDPKVVNAVTDILMRSREAVVDYMTPLGLHHIMDTGHHHGPGPWVSTLKRPEWNPTYYHQAGRDGIGFDRTKTGSNAIAQYAPELERALSDPRTTPEKFLLWFHRLPWDYKMRSGRTLWAEMVHRYDAGVAAAADLRKRWSRLKPVIDPRRHEEVAALLVVQEQEAKWWRDACIAYFQSVSGLKMPAGTKAPPLSVDEYRKKHFPYAPGRG
ncbi:alpha-glucuronidase [Betaproteobacteria bacterium GR16-43]|nr:alpha-glucuronidase [Betaproteobacteria bacterium GR16-43]